MMVNGFKAFVAVNVVSTVTHRMSHAFSPSSLSFLAKSRNSFNVLPLNAHGRKHTQKKGVAPKITIDPRANLSKKSELLLIEKEAKLRNNCIAFGKDAWMLSGQNVTDAWAEYSELTGFWWRNHTMSLEKVVHDFNKSVLNYSSSSSSSESSSISIDNRPAVQENGRKQLVMKIIDAFITAKQVENRLFTVITEDENCDLRIFKSTLDEEKRVFLSKEGNEISADLIESVQSTGLIDGKETCHLENDDEVSSWLTKVLGADWKSPQDQKEDLLAKLEKAFEKDNIGFFDYIRHLVDVEYPGGLMDFQFETVRDRSSFLARESGSTTGKTSYVQNYVRDNVGLGNQKFEAALYNSLDNARGKTFGVAHRRSTEEEKLYKIIQDTRDLIDMNETEIDDKLGNIQTHLFEKRNNRTKMSREATN